MQTGGQLYEIQDGVRRAKAAQLAGHSSISAHQMDAAGRLIRAFEVPIALLRSRHKAVIERITPAQKVRWQRIWQGARQSDLPFPPILVMAGGRGVKVEDITFDFGAAP